MTTEQKESGGFAKAGRKSVVTNDQLETPTLADAGISKDLSSPALGTNEDGETHLLVIC